VTLIDRPTYLDLMVGYLDKPVIKVLASRRRSGQSSLLARLAARLEDRGDGEPFQRVCLGWAWSIGTVRALARPAPAR